MVKLTFRHYRILFLLSLLIYVVADQAIAKHASTSWLDTLNVVIYPINGDSSKQSQQTINTLSKKDFSSIKHFIKNQSTHFGLLIDQPIDIKIAPQINKPPALPSLDAGIVSTMLWSLKMRWWAWHENTYSGAKDIRLFVEYYAEESAESQISVGLEKGRMALIKNYADKQLMERNNVIIAHEMLHTLGATDKYDSVTLMPSFPQGYAYPELGRNEKRDTCEIMGGRIPYADDIAVVPESLSHCLIGKTTAKEIGWVK